MTDHALCTLNTDGDCITHHPVTLEAEGYTIDPATGLALSAYVARRARVDRRTLLDFGVAWLSPVPGSDPMIVSAVVIHVDGLDEVLDRIPVQVPFVIGSGMTFAMVWSALRLDPEYAGSDVRSDEAAEVIRRMPADVQARLGDVAARMLRMADQAS